MVNYRRNLIQSVVASVLLFSAVPQVWAQNTDNTAGVDPSGIETSDSWKGTEEQNSSNSTDSTQEADAREQQMNAAVYERNRGIEHYQLATYYFSKWDFRMAELEYECAIMYYPTMKIAHRDYCIVSLFRGQPLRALAELFMVIGLGEPIPLNETERVALKARAAKMHFEEGIAAGRKLHWNKAISEFQYALEYAPDNANIERSLAFSFASKGDFDQAEKAYSRSFEEDPGDGYSHADFAFLLAEKGRGDRAMAQLNEAVKLEPRDAALHVDMGWMAESKSDLATAATEFEAAVKLSPRHAGLWTHLGKILEKSGELDQAIDAYQHALALDPTQDDAKQHLDALKLKQATQKSKGPALTTGLSEKGSDEAEGAHAEPAHAEPAKSVTTQSKSSKGLPAAQTTSSETAPLKQHK